MVVCRGCQGEGPYPYRNLGYRRFEEGGVEGFDSRTHEIASLRKALVLRHCSEHCGHSEKGEAHA
jgi:hypothetical protein